MQAIKNLAYYSLNFLRERWCLRSPPGKKSSKRYRFWRSWWACRRFTMKGLSKDINNDFSFITLGTLFFAMTLNHLKLYKALDISLRARHRPVPLIYTLQTFPNPPLPTTYFRSIRFIRLVGVFSIDWFFLSIFDLGDSLEVLNCDTQFLTRCCGIVFIFIEHVIEPIGEDT
jgi:hypothetical protein